MSDDGRIWSLSRRTAIAMALVGLLLLAASAFAVSGHHRSPTARSNRVRAQIDAADLLALVALPVRAVRTAGPPARSLTQPAQRPASPQLVDIRGFWEVPGTPSGILAYVAAHLPKQGVPTSSGSGSGSDGVVSASFGFRPVAGVLSSRQLTVSAVALAHGMVGVRGDGQDIWITPRPAWDRVPPGVRSVLVAAGANGTTTAPRTVTTAPTVRAIVAAVNRLPLFLAGAFSCPAATDETVTLGFRSGSGATVASAVESPTGCASVTLTVGGRRGPALSDNPSVSAELERLGVLRLPATGIGPAH